MFSTFKLFSLYFVDLMADSSRTRHLTIGPISEKGLPCARPAGKASAQEALLLCVELDKADPVLEDLLPTLSHKVPKVVAGALAALTLIYHNFGCKIVDPKPTLKALTAAFHLVSRLAARKPLLKQPFPRVRIAVTRSKSCRAMSRRGRRRKMRKISRSFSASSQRSMGA